jgi:hypothetical protein
MFTNTLIHLEFPISNHLINTLIQNNVNCFYNNSSISSNQNSLKNQIDLDNIIKSLPNSYANHNSLEEINKISSKESLEKTVKDSIPDQKDFVKLENFNIFTSRNIYKNINLNTNNNVKEIENNNNFLLNRFDFNKINNINTNDFTSGFAKEIFKNNLFSLGKNNVSTNSSFLGESNNLNS